MESIPPSPTQHNGRDLEVAIAEMSDRSFPPSGSSRNPYRGVVFVLLLAALLGTMVAAVGAQILVNPVLLDVGVSLWLAAGILAGVVTAQTARARPENKEDEETSISRSTPEPDTTELPKESSNWDPAKLSPRLMAARDWISNQFRKLGTLGMIRVGTAIAGLVGIALALPPTTPDILPTPLVAGIAAALCLGAAGLAGMGAHYFSGVDASRFPEGPWLCRGARVIAWILLLAAVSVGLEWARLNTIVQILHFLVLTVNAAVCYGLVTLKLPVEDDSAAFPMHLGILSALGSRANILGSILDSAERQLGIDLRSTWALTVVRQTLEPLLIGLCLLGWLSTSLTVVGVDEQGLVERLGVPVEGQPLQPGLHLHWPWPVDQVFRISVQRVQAAQVGHEGVEEEGPENVLWAVEHAPNEYTLVLGNGRDLITVDAAVQYRITDARAWRYHCQNPAEALRAIAYRAVMRSTVNRTLSDALSQNVATLTGQMRSMVQQDANALGLGVEILGFTVGGMHPPVPVAAAYEAVISAEISKVTNVVNAQIYRNDTVPTVEASAQVSENTARADSVNSLALATGEAWSFRALESQYRASPEEYFFRRRLETLEKGLSGKLFTVVDSRFQRDGGELWLTQ
jgi:regulator of protease activity HflC (stomatin/prohibitin superfamily)